MKVIPGDPGQEAVPSDLDANLPGTVVEDAHSPAAPAETRSAEEAAAPGDGGKTAELAPDAVQEEQENGRAAGERLP